MDALDDIRTRTLAAIDASADPAALDAVRVAALGKKGDVTGLMKTLGGLDPDARRSFGQAVNQLKDEVSAALDGRRKVLNAAALDQR